MKRIPWHLEESVALFDLYFKNGGTGTASAQELDQLSHLFLKRAETLGLEPDEKFRNQAGLSMQLACIHYVVTNGSAGLSGASKLFYTTYNLYRDSHAEYSEILRQFYAEYS